MALFGFIRAAFERDPDLFAPAPELTPAPVPYDPVMRLIGQALVGGIISNCDVTHDDAWMRLYHLPVHSVALLDSPAGWIALAHQMGLPPRVTVH